MKEEFITKVLMLMELGQEQCRNLKEILYIVLQEYELTERSTELMDVDKTYIHFLQLFLARKKDGG